jgi:Protein of unknown function (DUF2971)
MIDPYHNLKHFYKYTSSETALKVVKNRSFRWSAPSLFNDPFDHQTGFKLEIDEADFAKKLTESIERLVFGELEPEQCTNNHLNTICLLWREYKNSSNKDGLMQKVREATVISAAKMQASFSNMNSDILQTLNNSRIFCVTERKDNLVMWSHYADEHRGVVFKLRCLDELDNRLLAAKKVDYTDQFIQFPTDDYAMHVTGEKPIDLNHSANKMAYLKHIDWKYENEWRVRLPLLNVVTDRKYDDWSENPKSFDSVYLGCRMLPEKAEKIIQLCAKKMPLIKIYKAVMSKHSFSLDFVQIN